MEGASGGADFHDWEILLVPEAAGDDRLSLSYAAVEESDGFDDGAYLSDYFALDSEQRYRKEPSLANGTPAAEEIVPESSSADLNRPKDEPIFALVDFPAKENGCLWSEDPSDGERSLNGNARGDLAEDGALEEKKKEDGVGENGVSWSDELPACQRSLVGSGTGELGETGDSKAGEVGVRDLGIIDRTEAKDEDVNFSGEEPLSIVGKGEGRKKSSKDILAWNAEKRGMVLWKLPLELLKLCAFRVKPVWYISMAAAVLGILLLGKRLQKMKHDKRTIRLKIILDEKKASQLTVQVARLNEAFSVVRSTRVIRSRLPAGGLVPWPMLSLPQVP